MEAVRRGIKFALKSVISFFVKLAWRDTITVMQDKCKHSFTLWLRRKVNWQQERPEATLQILRQPDAHTRTNQALILLTSAFVRR
jgi:hypothetical protein